MPEFAGPLNQNAPSAPSVDLVNVPDFVARDNASNVASYRIGQIVRVSSDGHYYQLVSTGPLVWTDLGTSLGGAGGPGTNYTIVSTVVEKDAIVAPDEGMLVHGTLSGRLWRYVASGTPRWIVVANLNPELYEEDPAYTAFSADKVGLRVYVNTAIDATPGSDVTGEGTITAPYETAEFAIDQAPAGLGNGRLILLFGAGDFLTDEIQGRGRRVRFVGSQTELASYTLAGTTDLGIAPGTASHGLRDVGAYGYTVNQGTTWLRQDLSGFGYPDYAWSYGQTCFAGTSPTIEYVDDMLFADFKMVELTTRFTRSTGTGSMYFRSGSPDVLFEFAQIKFEPNPSGGNGSVLFTGACSWQMCEMLATDNTSAFGLQEGCALLEASGVYSRDFRFCDFICTTFDDNAYVRGFLGGGSTQNPRWDGPGFFTVTRCHFSSSGNGRDQLRALKGAKVTVDQSDLPNSNSVSGSNAEADGAGSEVHFIAPTSIVTNARDAFFARDRGRMTFAAGSVSGSTSTTGPGAGLTLSSGATAAGVGNLDIVFVPFGNEVECGGRAPATFALAAGGLTDFALGDTSQACVVED